MCGSTENVKKKYFAGIRKDTENDDFRSEFNKAVQRKNENQGRITLASNFNSGNTEHLSSGWINMTEAYNKNTSNIYDPTAEFFILPVVNAPEVHKPTVPIVKFKAPDEPPKIDITSPDIASINVAPVNIPNITVTPPSVTMPTAPASPDEIKVVVKDPNINITIDDINVAGHI